MNTKNLTALFSRKTAVIATLILVAGAVVFGLIRQSQNTITSPFPEKSSVRVTMKPANVNEDIRYSTTWPDGSTLMNERVERKDGVTIYRTFNHRGLKQQVTEYYPLPKVNGVEPVATNEDGTAVFPSSQPFEFNIKGRQLKSLIVFAADGKEVVSTELYRPDGTREVVGKRLPEGSFQNLVFHKDGLTLSFSQLFARNGDLLTEQQFAEGGSRLIASAQREADGNLHSKSFREDGTLLSVGILKQYQQIIDFYHTDGVTRRMTVINTSNGVSVTYFREDGEAYSKRTWNSYGGMTVVELVPGTGRYGPMGVVEKEYTTRTKQSWKVIPADTATNTPERTVLTELEVVGADGVTQRKFVFDEKTGAVTRIWMYNDGKNTHDRMYNPDGTLKEVGWVGSDDVSKAYNAQHKGDANRQPGAPIDPADQELIKRYGKDVSFEDPRPLLSKVEAEPQQYYGDHD
jgi:hypothetical protein